VSRDVDELVAIVLNALDRVSPMFQYVVLTVLLGGVVFYVLGW